MAVFGQCPGHVSLLRLCDSPVPPAIVVIGQDLGGFAGGSGRHAGSARREAVAQRPREMGSVSEDVTEPGGEPVDMDRT